MAARDHHHLHQNSEHDGKNSGKGRARYLKQRAISNSLIAGPGLFFTCPRGKEAGAVFELRDLLERVAEEFKPASTDDGGGKGNDEDVEGQKVQEEEDMDVSDEEDLDIETQIQRELDSLRTADRRRTDGSHQQKMTLKRFESKKMDCECLGFIKFPKPYDPVGFARHIVKQIQQGTSGYGLRFIQRITPVSMTCSSISLQEFERMATHVLEPHFGLRSSRGPCQETGSSQAGPSTTRVGLKFRIEPIIRCHDKPLNRAEVIKIVGETVNKFNSDEYLSVDDQDSIGHDPSSLKHRVSIDHAEIVILVSVYRYVCGISVVREYDRDGKRFNLQALAETREKQMTVEMK